MDTVAKCALDLNYNVKYIVVKNFKSFGSPRELLKNVKNKKLSIIIPSYNEINNLKIFTK